MGRVSPQVFWAEWEFGMAGGPTGQSELTKGLQPLVAVGFAARFRSGLGGVSTRRPVRFWWLHKTWSDTGDPLAPCIAHSLLADTIAGEPSSRSSPGHLHPLGLSVYAERRILESTRWLTHEGI